MHAEKAPSAPVKGTGQPDARTKITFDELAERLDRILAHPDLPEQHRPAILHWTNNHHANLRNAEDKPDQLNKLIKSLQDAGLWSLGDTNPQPADDRAAEAGKTPTAGIPATATIPNFDQEYGSAPAQGASKPQPQPSHGANFCAGHTARAIGNQLFQITWREILARAEEPQKVGKLDADWFIACNSPARTAEACMQPGVLSSALVAEFDKNPPTPAALSASVQLIFGDAEHLIYTTFSATKEQPRCRLVIPVLQALDPIQREACQNLMHAALVARGHTPDASANDPSHVQFLPNDPRGISEAADATYEHVIHTGAGRADPLVMWADEIESYEPKASREVVSNAAPTDGFAQMADPFWNLDKMKQALSSINPSFSHLEKGHRRLPWRIVGFACHRQLGPDVGLRVFQAWSRGDLNDFKPPENYNPKEMASEWEMICKEITEGSDIGLPQMLALAPEGVIKGIRLGARSVAAEPFEQAESGSAPLPLFVKMKELLGISFAPNWVIKGWLEADTLNALAGPPKQGKSFIALDMAMHVAAGLQWCGHKVKQGPVFIIAGEGHGGIARRIEGWLLNHPEVSRDIPVYVSRRAVLLDAKDDAVSHAAKVADTIVEMTGEHGVKPVLNVVDTLSRNFAGEENSNTDMARFVQEVDRYLKHRFKACVLIVHHSTKDGGQLLRGASALLGALDGLIEVAKDSDHKGEGMRVTVTPHFLKDSEAAEAKEFWCRSVVVGMDEDLEAITTLVPELDDPEEFEGLTEQHYVVIDILKRAGGTMVRADLLGAMLAGEHIKRGAKKTELKTLERLLDKLIKFDIVVITGARKENVSLLTLKTS